MNWKKLSTGILCAVLAVPTAVPVISCAAEVPEVIYDGEEKAFTLENVSERDLFPEFKAMMPGDSTEQKIKIRVENIDAPVTVYLTAEDAADADRALFQDVALRVEADGRVLSDTPLSEDGGLEDGVELFSFDSPGEQTINVTLSVSPETGNELMDKVASVRWTFTVQDYDKGDEEDQKAAQTGDPGSRFPWTAAASISIGASILLFFSQSQKRKKQLKQ